MTIDTDKQEMINQIIDAIEAEAEFIYNKKDLTSMQKLSKIDVLLDIKKFLKNYDRNVKILNQHTDYRFEGREQ